MSLRTLLRVSVDVLVLGLGVLSLVDAVGGGPVLHPLAVACTLVWVGAMLSRRRVPWSPLLVPLVLAGQAIALESWPNDSAATLLALALAAALYGARVPTRRALAAGWLWPATIAVFMVATEYGEAGWSDLFYPGVFLLLCLGAGMVAARSIGVRKQAREAARRAEEDLQRSRRVIAASERARIAADLRALVAAEIRSVQERVAHTRTLLAAAEVAPAEEALLAIEDAGRETLADLRHMLGLLRRDMTEGALRPQPGITALDGIVTSAERRGLAVALAVEGDQDPLPPGVELVVYRVVERAVDRASRAGLERATVRIRYAPEDVEVRVHASGLGPLLLADQPAIRERVLVYGGDLLTGTDEEGQDVIRVRLPLPATGAKTPT